jgi:hypothetical protein
MRLLLGLLAMAWLWSCKSVPPTQRAGDEPLVRLERTACFGRCPVYSVTVSSTGVVVFDGEHAVKVLGRSSAQLTPARLGELVARLERSSFAQWKDFVSQDMTDQPGAVLTFRGKTVRHYHGDEKAPPELKQLEDEVDALIGTSQWVSGEGAPVQ